MFLPVSEMEDTALYYLPSLRKMGFHLYYLVILLVTLGFVSLFYIHVFISVQAPGIIRPFLERTEVRSTISGIIDTLYFKEGDLVEKNAPILTIRDKTIPIKKQFNEEEIVVQKNFIHDLLLLTSLRSGPEKIIPLLVSPLYKEQAGKFFSQDAEQGLNLKKANREAFLNQELAKDKVISAKELFDVEVQQGKMLSAYNSFRKEQFAQWQEDLVKYRSALADCLTRREEFRARNDQYCIRAPVSGVVQGINSRYRGSAIQPDETICSVSPNGQLIGECYVASRDIGMLRPGQQVRFQIDAFNYHYFGVITGNIISLDNDFTQLDNKAVFKVRCRFDNQQIALLNGYQGRLKKGLTFQARFISTSRTLWQLLYDTLDDWLNPAAPPTHSP